MYRRSSFVYYETYYKKEGFTNEVHATAYSNKCLEGKRCARVLWKHEEDGTITVVLQCKRVWYE